VLTERYGTGGKPRVTVYSRSASQRTSGLDIEQLVKENVKNSFLANVLLPMVLALTYMFLLIPSFNAAANPARFFIRVVCHPLIKGQSDVRQRDAFATGSFDSTVKAQSLAMFAMEAVWSISGRFLMVRSSGSSYGWYIATLFCTAYMEFFFRVNAEPLAYHKRVHISKLPPLKGQELINYRIANACSQAQDDAVEQGAIIVAGASQFALYSQRAAVSLGFGLAPPTMFDMLMGIGLQLAVEIPTDIVTTSMIIDSGILVHEYYNECDEDGVVTPHTFMMKVAESYSFSLGFFASMMFFRVAPIVGFCGGANICTCVFDFEAVKVLCGM